MADTVETPQSTPAPAAPVSLNTIIADAHTEVSKPDDSKPAETKPGEAKETKTGEDKSKSGIEAEAKPEASAEKKPDAATELTPEQQQYAKDLFLALNDPNSAKIVVEALAKQAGLIETKAEEKVVVKTITELLKENLGEDLSFLGDKLAPAIEATVKQLVAEQTKDIRESQ